MWDSVLASHPVASSWVFYAKARQKQRFSDKKNLPPQTPPTGYERNTNLTCSRCTSWQPIGVALINPKANQRCQGAGFLLLLLFIGGVWAARSPQLFSVYGVFLQAAFIIISRTKTHPRSITVDSFTTHYPETKQPSFTISLAGQVSIIHMHGIYILVLSCSQFTHSR